MATMSDIAAMYRAEQARPGLNERSANRARGLAGSLQGVGGPGGAFINSALNSYAAVKENQPDAEKDARLKRIDDMMAYQNQQAEYLDGIKSSTERLKLSMLERTERQASIDEALSMAEQFGDTAGINKVLDGMPATKELIAKELPEGAALTGAVVVNGHLLPVGAMPDGSQVFGREGLPIGRMYSPERQAANLRSEGEARTAKAELELTEAKTRKVNSEMAGMPPEPAAGAPGMLQPPPEVPGSSPAPLPQAPSPVGAPVTPGPTLPQVGKLTEAQGKNTGYGIRMSGAMETLNALEGQKGFDPANLGENLAAEVPIVGNYALSNDFQKYRQSQREFLAGILRGDTGAAITSEEFKLYGPMYFPQPGDGADVINQKREARGRAFDATRVIAGPGAQAIPQPRDASALKQKYGLE